jgi:uncharacterized membrane protein YGL010W
MKSIQQWYDEYAESHQNPTNQKMHFINVPIIYFSIVGLFMSINSSFLQEKIGLANPLIENWATILLVFVLTFYLRLSFNVFLKMFVFSVISVVGNYYIQQNFNLLYISIILFVLAWAGQFYGHKIEGKKPSFFKDLQFLLIGPPWVFKKMFKANKE